MPNHPVNARHIRWVEGHREVDLHRLPPAKPTSTTRDLCVISEPGGSPSPAHGLPCPKWPPRGHPSQATPDHGCVLRAETLWATRLPETLFCFDISKERVVQLPEDPLRGEGDREALKSAHKGPTQQVLLKNGAELLFRQKGAQLPQAPGRGDARVVLMGQRRW